MVIATEVNAEVYNIKMTDIATSAYINEGAKNIKELFQFIRIKAAKNPRKHIIVILDEMDALLKKRDGTRQGDEDKKIVNTFLTEMSGFDKNGNTIFIGTTNDLESIDSAVARSGRFSVKIKVDMPDQTGRKDVYSIHTAKSQKKAKRSGIFSDTLNLDALAIESEGLSGADIKESIRRVLELRAMKEIETMEDEQTRRPIETEEIIESIKHLKKSNGKANQLLASFSPEELRKLPKERQAFVRDAISQILLDQHLKELREAVTSGKVSTRQLQEIYDEKISGKEMGF